MFFYAYPRCGIKVSVIIAHRVGPQCVPPVRSCVREVRARCRRAFVRETGSIRSPHSEAASAAKQIYGFQEAIEIV